MLINKNKQVIGHEQMLIDFLTVTELIGYQ